MKHKLYLLILIGIAFLLRIYGINWDNGFHFHPDERMLIMVAERIHFFNNLNPDFFNYGSLPVYILRGVSQFIELFSVQPIATYDGMLYVGRYLSLLNDIAVLILIYKISLLLFEKKQLALFAVFFYTFSFFPIQNTHFFIVDTFLNLFSTLLIYLLLRYYKKPSLKVLLFISATFAAAITTKVSAVLFAPIIALVLFLSIKGKLQHKVGGTLKYGIILAIPTLLFSFMFMPFGFIEYQKFISEISLQLRMNSDPYTFPYTLQYVGTLPYLYYLKNIAIWGAGPFIFVYFLLGLYEFGAKIPLKKWKQFIKQHHKAFFMVLIMFLFYSFYFLVIGKSAVKFMRYMLLLYPFIAIVAAFGAEEMLGSLTQKKKRIVMIVSALLIAVWTLAFVNIYSERTTRIRASEWIYQHIPTGSTLAVEHWDDRIPIYDAGKYNYQEMTLYERPDNAAKWDVLNQKLAQSDYIIIASNRLYVPLQRLGDCSIYTNFCYYRTSQYYKKLFEGDTDFIKIAEFTSYPNITIGPWTLEIIDDSADESFTVYDHPKIIIYRRNE